MKKTIGCLTGFSLAGAVVLSLSPASAYSVDFNGSVTIDFSSSSNPTVGALLGTQTLNINTQLNLPYTQAELLMSLADGDTSLPASLLLDNFFPQTLSPGLTFNSVAISAFSASGLAVAASGDTTNFNIQYVPTDPVLGIPVFEISNFNHNLLQCVTNSCNFTNLSLGTLSAAFDFTYLGMPATLNITSASSAFALQASPVPSPATSVPEPSTLLGLLLIVGLGAFNLKRHYC